jgi:hypothetical protein
MSKKIDKDYLGKTLSHFDQNGNQIIDIQEWVAFFEDKKDNLWEATKEVMKNILTDIFPHENPDHLPVLVDAILTNHSEDTADGKEVNLVKLYNYAIRFIAPQKYRAYQQTLDDKTEFFLYDGMIQRDELEIFTDESNRLMSADIYYLIVSYHITPHIAEKIIDNLIANENTDYNPCNYTFDADGLFNLLAIKKYNAPIIDIDAINNYIRICNINIDDDTDNISHLFGIHNDLAQNIIDTGCVDYETVCYFLNFYDINYLKLAIASLLDALSLELDNHEALLSLIDFMGYIGKPDKIFREIAGYNDNFNLSDIQSFLDDNHIRYKIRQDKK